MMKTPMQELIDKLYELSEMHASDMYKAGMRDAAIIAETMLEKEKEMMVDFAYKCRNVMAADEFAISKWHDKTFDTKEK